MGSWGYGPLDTDLGSDWLFDIEKNIIKQLYKLIKQFNKSKDDSYYQEVRAASHLMVVLRENNIALFDSELIDNYILAITKILNDTDFIESWDNPKKVKKSLRTQLKSLENLI